MRSVGPFELTDTEFAGMEILWREDERELRNSALRATWHGHRLIVESFGTVAVPTEVGLFQFGVLVKNRSRFRLQNEAGPETGESGETADVEAESEIMRKNSEILQLDFRRSRGSAFGRAMTR
jgi:hypothetical protein